MSNYHTIPDGNGNWQVKKEGAKRTSGNFDTQKEAMDYGKELLRKLKVNISFTDETEEFGNEIHMAMIHFHREVEQSQNVSKEEAKYL